MDPLWRTFKMYPIFNRWVHCGQVLSVPTMYSPCAHWVYGSLSPVSTSLYLAQRQALSKNIISLHVPQCLYMPVSLPCIDSIDPVLLTDHPENIELWLPSTFPPSSLHAQCVDGLPQLECRLWCTQAAVRPPFWALLGSLNFDYAFLTFSDLPSVTVPSLF